jgi:uncharacterized membrane protein YhdT
VVVDYLARERPHVEDPPMLYLKMICHHSPLLMILMVLLILTVQLLYHRVAALVVADHLAREQPHVEDPPMLYLKMICLHSPVLMILTALLILMALLTLTDQLLYHRVAALVV